MVIEAFGLACLLVFGFSCLGISYCCILIVVVLVSCPVNNFECHTSDQVELVAAFIVEVVVTEVLVGLVLLMVVLLLMLWV